MRCSRITIYLILLAVADGCAAHAGVSPELRDKSARLPILSAVTDRQYKILGDVDALSCAWSAFERHASMADAGTRLRVAAYQLGADAIIGENCVGGGTDWHNNCDETIKCKAVAIRWLGSPGAAARSKTQDTTAATNTAGQPDASDGGSEVMGDGGATAPR